MNFNFCKKKLVACSKILKPFHVLSLIAALFVHQFLWAGKLPKIAQGIEIPDKGYFVEEIKDGLYWVTDANNYQAMFLTTGEGVILVDAPLFMVDNVSKAIAEVTDEQVTHLIYSHSHLDHIGGASKFDSAKVIIAHEETKTRLMISGDPRRPPPTKTFNDKMTLNVGNQTLELSYTGPNHTIGNIFIYAPKQKVLMIVDVVAPGWSAWANMENAAYIPGLYNAVDHILTFDFNTFIGGHLNRLGDRKDVEFVRQHYLDLKANADKAIQTVVWQDAIKKVKNPNSYNNVSAYMDAISKECKRLTLNDWKGRIGGVEAFLYGTCWAIATSIMSD